MRVQVVHDKYDFIAIRIADIHKISDLINPVHRCTVCAHDYMAHAAYGFCEYKNTEDAVPVIVGLSKTQDWREDL